MPPSTIVVVGPARCGKTHELVAQYRQVLQSAGGVVDRALWLAPTARNVAKVRQKLIEAGLIACLDPGIMTFDALAERVLGNAVDAPRRLAPLMQRVLVRRVIDTALAEKRLEVLAESARRASFIDLVDEHFHELKRRGITPDNFARAVNSHLDRRLHEELARLFADYERLLAAHSVCDDEGRHWAVRDALAGDASRLANLELVVADGFTDFTHTQLEILDKLSRRAARLLVSLPGDDPSAVGRGELFAKSAATLAELRRRHPQLAVRQMPGRETTWPALDHIAQHLFRHPRDIPAPSPAAAASLDRLEIVAAASAQDEIMQLARNVKRRLVGGGPSAAVAQPGDVIVVFRNLRAAAPRVREVFEEFGIPYSLEAGLPLAATGVVRTMLDLLRLDLENWPFRRVVSAVTNNLLTAFERRERTAAEWLVCDLQIAQGRDALLSRVETLAGEVATSTGEQPNAAPQTHHDRQVQAAAIALPFLNQLASAFDELPTEASPSVWIAALSKLGERLGIRCLTATADELNQDSENRLAWQCITKCFALLERLAEWMHEPVPLVSREGVLYVLVDLASHESLPRSFDDTGRVRVLSAATARTVEAKHVFLAGMSEQSFPSPERTGRLYSEADYRFFANAADQAQAATEPLAIQRSHEEMLLFYEVLTRASERLTISYPALDDKALALPPSPYVTEVERTIEPASVTHQRAVQPSPLPGGRPPLGPADWRIQAVNNAIQGDRSLLAGFFRSGATGSASAIEAALRVTASRSRRDAFGPAEGLLASDAVRVRLARRFGSDHLWSPSQWETYAVCPYRFFMEQVLGLEPLGELVLETDYSRRGSLVHRALAEFHRRLPELFGAPGRVSQHDVARFVAEFENVLEAMVRAAPHVGVEAALVEIDRRQIARWGPRYHAEHGKYDDAWAALDTPPEPTYLEWRFGPPRSDESDYEDPRSTRQPFVLDVGGEQIRITGRIDRIDVGQSAGRTLFNVIDYKSGKRPSLSAEKIASGERLQPALYMMAAQALLFGDDTATPLWAGYWSMKSGVNTDRRFSLHCSQDQQTPSQDWESLRDEVVEQIGRFLTDIRGGNFPVVSRDEHCTSKCSFSTVCRIGQVRSLGKQWFPDETDA